MYKPSLFGCLYGNPPKPAHSANAPVFVIHHPSYPIPLGFKGIPVDGRNPAPLGNHDGKPLFIGIYGGIVIRGRLRWCEMDFVHPQAHSQPPVSVMPYGAPDACPTPGPGAHALLHRRGQPPAVPVVRQAQRTAPAAGGQGPALGVSVKIAARNGRPAFLRFLFSPYVSGKIQFVVGIVSFVLTPSCVCWRMLSFIQAVFLGRFFGFSFCFKWTLCCGCLFPFLPFAHGPGKIKHIFSSDRFPLKPNRENVKCS